ncbi:MAG TPA: carbamoyl-phosphate synthase subunit L [Pseudoflavonifractor sp.]|nr:carbamoyl-phosphate synthase subunit L [Pseudoflavonifractor sp.]
MLEQMVKAVIDKTLSTEYPHLTLPAIVYATITSAKSLANTYEAEELVIYNDDSGVSYRGHIVAPWYEYNLVVINRDGLTDETFPPIPGVRSKKQFKLGAVVAIAWAYGDIIPTIIGEVEI